MTMPGSLHVTATKDSSTNVFYESCAIVGLVLTFVLLYVYITRKRP